MCRAVARINNKTIGCVIVSRNAKTFRRFYEKLKHFVKHYYTDDWEVYRKVIPLEKLTQGKKHTIGIEQNNSNARHYLGIMRRRTKVVTKSIEMLNISLLISCDFNEYSGYEFYQDILFIYL